MPFFGRKTLADCAKLEAALAPALLSLDRDFHHVRPVWVEKSPFASLAWERDAKALFRRWNAATALAGRIGVPRRSTPRTTPADAAYLAMVRAVRQGGPSAAPRTGDLTDLTRRLRYVARRLPRAGFGMDSFGQHTYDDLVALTHLYDGQIAQLRQRFETVRGAWTSRDASKAADFAQDLGLLEVRWAAVHAKADSALGGAAGLWNKLAMNGAEMYYAEYMKVIVQGYPPDGAHVQKGDYSDLDTRLKAAESAAGVATPSPAVRGYAAPDTGFAKPGWADPNQGGVLGTLGNLGAHLANDKPMEQRGPDPWYVAPLSNPWIVGGLVVGSIGVVGYTLGQVRALLPAPKGV
jgi:hypothetical protein